MIPTIGTNEPLELPVPSQATRENNRCMLTNRTIGIILFSIGTNDSFHWYQWTPFLSPLTPVESICEYWTTLALVRVLSKCLCGEAPPRDPTPYPFIYHFSRKRYLFRIPSIDKWYPFHIPCLKLCIPFNCCKCTVI